MSRKPKRETIVAWESDVAVPHHIRADAQALGAVGRHTARTCRWRIGPTRWRCGWATRRAGARICYSLPW